MEGLGLKVHGLGSGAGLGLLSGASTPPGPGELSAFRLWSPTGGYPFQFKKGVRRVTSVWGEDLEGGACSDNLYTFGPRPRRIQLPLF